MQQVRNENDINSDTDISIIVLLVPIFPRAHSQHQTSHLHGLLFLPLCVIGDYLRPLIIHENNVDELCRVVNALSDDIKAQIDGLFPFLSLPSPSSSFTSPHSSSTYNKPESERPKNLLRTLSRGLDKTVSDAQERLSYCAEIKMRVEVQFFEPLPSHLAYPGIIEAQEEKKAARLAAKNESKLRNKNHKKDNNKNSDADDNMNGNGNGNGSREGDGEDGDNDGDIGRHEEMGKIFNFFIFVFMFIVCVTQHCSLFHIIPILVPPLPSTSQLLSIVIQFFNSNWSH